MFEIVKTTVKQVVINTQSFLSLENIIRNINGAEEKIKGNILVFKQRKRGETS